MKIHDNILDAVGRTPLIKLSRLSRGLPVTLLAKAEFLNPGGSVKDRIGLAMIEDAEQRGLLKSGGTIIEATAGNTGVGLALVAASKGYRCIFVLPDKMSEDKVNLLKAFGAEVVITPTQVASDSPESYNGVADRLARDIQGSFRPNQFANPVNPETHYRTTGPEIWEDTEGKIDVFVAGMGTGGTISGVGKFLKEKNPDIRVVGADPEGSILSGDIPRSWKVEGIGEDFIPATFNRQVIDEMVRVSDAEAFAMARRLTREEGLLVGGSSGTAVAAALKYAKRLASGKNIVVMLPDTGRNYLSKVFSDRWMRENGFSDPGEHSSTVGDMLDWRNQSATDIPLLVTIDPDQSAKKAVDLMVRYQISQLPVLRDKVAVGSITEVTLVRLLHDGVNLDTTTVGQIMGKPLPHIDSATDSSEAYRLLLAGHDGILVFRGITTVGFLSRIDLVRYWSFVASGEGAKS